MALAQEAPPTTLPASWFTSESLYQLERRGIFDKVRKL